MAFLISGRNVSDASFARSTTSVEHGSSESTQTIGVAAPAAVPDGIAERQARLPESSTALRDAASLGSSTASRDARGERDASHRDAAGMLSEAVVGVEAHRIVPHRYEMRSIEPKINLTTGQPRNSSVAGLFDTKTNLDASGTPRGQFEVRFDGSHPYQGTQTGPHLNLGVGEHNAVPVSGAVIGAAEKAASVLKVLDRAAVPVGIAIDIGRLGSAFHADGNKVGKETVHTAGSVAGGWAGTLAGAAGGAEAGATIGLFGGPVGAAIGGAAGGLLGGLAGSFGGAALGARIADATAK